MIFLFTEFDFLISLMSKLKNTVSKLYSIIREGKEEPLETT